MTALVNQTVGSSAASLNATATIPASVAGNNLFAFFARSGGLTTGAIASVTDSASQTWLRATRGAVSSVTNTRIELWYIENSASITSVTFSSTTSQTNAWNVLEFSGLLGSSSLDVASPDNSATASSTTAATPSITTSNASDLILAGWHFGQTTTSGLTSGWTALSNFDDTTVGSGRAAYQLASSTGSYSASLTLGAAKAAGVITAAFKASPGGVWVPTLISQSTGIF